MRVAENCLYFWREALSTYFGRVYDIERLPYLFAASSPWCSASRGFVSDSWSLLITQSKMNRFQQLLIHGIWKCLRTCPPRLKISPHYLVKRRTRVSDRSYITSVKILKSIPNFML